jgi:hypothetical protein
MMTTNRGGLSRRQKAVGAVTSFVAVMALSLGIAFAAGGSGLAQPGTATGPITTVDTTEAAAFGILRRPVTSADAVPTELAGDASSQAADQMNGTNDALARKVTGLGSLGNAWLIPGAGTLCLLANGSYGDQAIAFGGEVCSADSAAVTGQLQAVAMSSRAPGVMLIAGVVPDGVSTVTATFSTGSVQTVAVHDNVYMLDGIGSTSPTITFSDDTGGVTLPAMSVPGPAAAGG